MTVRLPRFAPLVVLVLALGACSSPSSPGSARRKTSAELTQVEAAVQHLSLVQRDAKLQALARREGDKLTLYTTLDPATLGPLVKGFEARYGVHVTTFTANQSALVARVGQETQAGRHEVDVIDTGGPELDELAGSGDFANFTSPLQADLGPGGVQRGWTTTRYTQMVVAWNTHLVKPGKQPTSWQELARPEWKGKISLDPTSTGVSLYLALSNYWHRTKGWSQAQSDRVFEGIARNARIVPMFTVNAQLLASGEIAVAVGSVASDNVELLRGHGAPITWQPAVDPVVRQRQGAALLRDAPHPAAAMLFLDYELGPGQYLFAAQHRDPALASLQPHGVQWTFVDLGALAAQQAALTRRWAQIIALGKPS